MLEFFGKFSKSNAIFLKVCAEIKRGLIKLKSIKQDIINIPDDHANQVPDKSEEIDLDAMETDELEEVEDPTEKMLGEAEDDVQTDNDVKEDVEPLVEDVKDDVVPVMEDEQMDVIVTKVVVQIDVEAAKEVGFILVSKSNLK